MLPTIYRQIYATVDFICLYYTNGFIFGIISVMLPSLRLPDSGVQLTADEESWIASLSCVLMFPAQCIGAFAAERLGRRRVMSVSMLPPAISLILLYCAHTASTLQAATTIMGLVGGGTGVGPILVAETSSPKYRGVLLSTKPLALLLGYCTVHLLGKFFNWRNVVLLGVAPCLLGLVTSLSSPESPAWLAARGRFRECERAFQWLRGAEDAAELRALVDSQRAARRKKAQRAKIGAIRNSLQYLNDKCFWKAASLSLACTLVMEAGGIFLLYYIDVIIMITSDTENAHYIAVGLDIQGFITAIVTCWLVKVFKRRTVLFSAGVPAICFLMFFCLLSFLLSRQIVSSSYRWLNLAFLSLFFLMRDLGFSVTHDIVGEVFPLSHRGLGIAFIGLAFTVLSFGGTKIFPTLLSMYGLHGAFLFSAVVLCLCLTYFYFFLPETSNKTMLDIEYELRKNNLEIINLKDADVDVTDENKLHPFV